MSQFLNRKYCKLEAYTPGEQPTDMKYVKLNTNESPFPPSDGVLNALNRSEIARLNLYPDPSCRQLKAKLAERYGTKPENVFVSNGSDDILNFSFMAFFNGEDRPVRFPNISYGFYRVYAELHGVQYQMMDLQSDFSVRREDYIGNRAGVVLANPNAPTGLALSRSEIEQIVQANPDHVVLIDEAYVDFGAESCVDLIAKYNNLLVVGTYSKSRSMAGARLGFAFGDAELIRDLEKIKYSTNPYNINRLTLLAGEAALDDWAYYENNCRIVASVREETQKKLREMGFVCTDSKTNFIFAKHPKLNGKMLYSELKKRGILVRHFDTSEICDYNRITVGTSEQMNLLIREISSILESVEKRQS